MISFPEPDGYKVIAAVWHMTSLVGWLKHVTNLFFIIMSMSFADD